MSEACWASCIAGLEIEVGIQGQVPKTIGFYSKFPTSGARPNLLMKVRVDDDYQVGPKRAPNAPSFRATTTPQCLKLDHRDSTGSLQFEADGAITANFVCSPSFSSLEAVLRVSISLALPLHGALLLHSSAVVDSRGAHIFSGVSGAGKSTIATLLDENYPVVKFSDELSILHKHEGEWWLTVSPFIGSDGLPHGESRPIASINFLEQHKRNARVRISRGQAMGELCQHILTYTQVPPAVSQSVLDLAADLVHSTPCYSLQFVNDPSVAEVLGITC